MTADELDVLLYQKFRLRREDMLAALKTLPAIRPWAAELSQDEARLLDDAGFTEDPGAYARVAADTVAHLALLVNTAYSAREVAAALNVNESRVRQRRLARTLWAINDNGAWVFPALQFETDPQTGLPHKQIRGLDRVFAALAPNLHPVAVAGFLRTPHPDLSLQGSPVHPLEWLQSGGDVDPVLRLVEAADWASR
ncbi:DNA-binding protein [Mycobacterium intracellulare]|uniref:DNA-binding protein n=1 Tax=Mycobacterium intracellulare TaxID=1767 RepID=A0AAE4RIR0_MYCIT|nr:DNA-binding protein [Mycobacterium intracellulare]MDV6979856.1 DNA-binding protein [Mycobacterium intracellulare]MDV6985417.1 DNA-binding protein [Mycobacterium intracellulare]MDV7015647.1 DNA-binding protein [Mycobacterium intracellulare]MDV7030358.1 DNA-binding protein [Mycobacterium intracellulare]